MIQVMTDATNSNYLSIKSWAEDDRPREKFLLKGRTALSDAELIAILISTGTKEESAVDLAKKILSLTENNLNALGKLSVSDLKKIKGIGEAKAITIIAAFELGRRRKDESITEKKQIISSKDSFHFFYPMLADLKIEEFWVLFLNRSNKILGYKKISEGGISGTVADTKIIFKIALEFLASSIVLCHNHPSGNNKPSSEDEKLTQKIKIAANLLDIHLVDHIIISDNSYYSFADENKI